MSPEGEWYRRVEEGQKGQPTPVVAKVGEANVSIQYSAREYLTVLKGNLSETEKCSGLFVLNFSRFYYASTRFLLTLLV